MIGTTARDDTRELPVLTIALNPLLPQDTKLLLNTAVIPFRITEFYLEWADW